MKDVVLGAKYRHYKGSIVTVLAKATHTENGENLVIYRHDSDGRIWARPFAIFAENVNVGGNYVPRFERVTKNAGNEKEVRKARKKNSA